MTMQNALHPDDERLAAYAGGDADVVSDRALAAHLISCDRCRPMVEELTLLRGALAALPDLAPSRPLRLIPPVPESPGRRPGALEWLRRLAAPAMAAGAGLVLIGAVGATGMVSQLSGKAASNASAQEASATNGPKAPAEGSGAHSLAPGLATDSSDYTGRTGEPRSQSGGTVHSMVPEPSAGEDLTGAGGNAGEQPWLTFLIGGFGLFGISAILRYSLAPRAG